MLLLEAASARSIRDYVIITVLWRIGMSVDEL